MLQLFINNRQLDTKGVSFNIVQKSPLFQNKLEGSYIFNLKLPDTAGNKKLINFSHRIENVNLPEDHNFSARFNGKQLFTGSFIYTGGKNSINGNVFINNGNFIYQTKDKYLDEIAYGTKTFVNEGSAIAYFNSNVNKYYPDVDFVLPYIQGSTDSYLPNGTTGYYQKDILNYYANNTYYFWGPGTSDYAIISPQFFLLFILKKYFNHFGYTFDDHVFINSDYKKLLLLNIFNANSGIPAYENKPGYNCDLININYTNHIPHVKIWDLLSGIQNLLNIRFFINNNTKQVKAIDCNNLITSPNHIDITNKVLNQTELDFKKYNGFFLKSIPDNLDDSLSFWSEQESNYSSQYGGFVNTLLDLPTIPVGYLYYYVISENSLYYWNGTSWVQYTDFLFLHTFFNQSSELKIESCISSLGSSSPVSLSNISAYDYLKIQPRLYFYTGLQGGLPSSNHELNNNELFYTSDLKLYNNHWKNYLDWILDPKIIKANSLLNVTDISGFDFSEKYRIDRNNYFVKDIITPVTEREILPSKMTCYRV